MKGRISRQVKHMPIQAQVTITEEAGNNNHKLEIVANDRPGLLATLAHKFLLHEIDLHNAKINTLGNRAEDTFLISGKKGQKLDAERIKTLRESLIEEI
jgi:[protein-PII] uridylyltransferase